MLLWFPSHPWTPTRLVLVFSCVCTSCAMFNFCARTMLIFSVSFQFYQMFHKGLGLSCVCNSSLSLEARQMVSRVGHFRFNRRGFLHCWVDWLIFSQRVTRLCVIRLSFNFLHSHKCISVFIMTSPYFIFKLSFI